MTTPKLVELELPYERTKPESSSSTVQNLTCSEQALPKSLDSRPSRLDELVSEQGLDSAANRCALVTQQHTRVPQELEMAVHSQQEGEKRQKIVP